MKSCSVTVDVDTLRSNFQGFGLRRADYSCREFVLGIATMLEFFRRFRIRATFFLVAQDLGKSENARMVKDLVSAGHEAASHSYSHPQGFRLLSAEDMSSELRRSKEVLESVTGQPVTGFRAPGWNIADTALPLLERLGYRYDSSVFPTLAAPLLKVLHYYAMRKRAPAVRTTLGQCGYAWAPVRPYRVAAGRLGRRGTAGFVEFPVQVAGSLRVPFYSTVHLSYPGLFKRGFAALRGSPVINYQMHLSDFVDFTRPEFAQEVPVARGSYSPAALRVPLQDKLRVWERIFATIAHDYTFAPLRDMLERV